jgi:hypothetical protein
MFLRCNWRRKDGKEHRYWSIVENRRCVGERVVQRQVLYLGEINDTQREAWVRSIEVFDEDAGCQKKLKLFAPERELTQSMADAVQVRLSEFELRRPRQWGACWLFCQLWEQLGLREFWSQKLGASRESTDWEHVLEGLVAYRLIDPGSEWRMHRHWYANSAMGDLLGEDDTLAAKDTLYRCLDFLLEHKRALLEHLSQRWQDLFGVKFEVLLYDLTSTYFESDPPFGEEDKRQFGYSRDKRPDCVQVVIGLIITPEGFPLGYEVLAGNTADKTTLRDFLKNIETQYGKAERIWMMDRGHAACGMTSVMPDSGLCRSERTLSLKEPSSMRYNLGVCSGLDGGLFGGRTGSVSRSDTVIHIIALHRERAFWRFVSLHRAVHNAGPE